MKKRHVMLIDDNNFDCFIANRIIANSHLTEKISMMNSAMEALDYLRKAQMESDDFPDLILLDVAMPVMDGFAFLDDIAKFQQVQNRTCIVVMLTSSANDKDIDKSKTYAYVKDYFVKPLTVEMLERLF
ncbi:response regulator [Flavobacterium sp. SUN046]|uniref:response regulator n=1 Tax=Flavobacterium sp. SUN046 TaxID=3002440 RepID=UPI002DBC8904|nr:response regulator [Flavobacterium sp. SUN046]MEC4050316.1 response regulator [Flavobacterium sp. SUN046]